MVWNIVPVGSIPTNNHEIYDGDGRWNDNGDGGGFMMMMEAKLLVWWTRNYDGDGGGDMIMVIEANYDDNGDRTEK